MPPKVSALSGRALLGAQIWLEPDDDAERIDRLFAQASLAGLGWVRLFLMWPWIEPAPGSWSFELFDTAFDAAARYGLYIKATLTANSPPAHVGTPAVLHSFTGFLDEAHRNSAARYVDRCVARYRGHVALGQWIIWNEPNGAHERSTLALARWRHFLADEYAHDIERLNARWRTALASFDAIPFAEDIAHPFHRGTHWTSYGPELDDQRFRTVWLEEQLAWVAQQVRTLDPDTELTANPSQLAFNHAHHATDVASIARTVDCVGASYHPSWHFTFAERARFPALVHAITRHKWHYPGVKRVEVTELQTGNTVNSGNKPCAVGPGEVVRLCLAGLAAGAASVTGWCLNTRRWDFEAGDWGLLDDFDQPSPRSQALADLSARLDRILQETGRWSPAVASTLVLTSIESQAVEALDAAAVPERAGRRRDDHVRGTFLIASILSGLGQSVAVIPETTIPTDGKGKTLWASHLVAISDATAAALVRFAESGGTVILDALTGRKLPTAELRRPWPWSTLSERLGYRAADIETDPEGFAVESLGQGAGTLVLARQRLLLEGQGWRSLGSLRFTDDGSALLYERPVGAGRLVACRGVLGPSLVEDAELQSLITRIASEAADVPQPGLRAIGASGTVSLPVACERGALTMILAADDDGHGGRGVRLVGGAGAIHDLWSDTPVTFDPAGEALVPSTDGILLLWKRP